MIAAEVDQVPAQVPPSRSVHIALINLHPVFERGLGVVLEEAGLRVAARAQWARWSGQGPGSFVAVITDEEPAYAALDELRSRVPTLRSVALVRSATTAAYARVLTRCTGAVAVDAELEDLVEAVRAAARGCAVIPAKVSAELAAGLGTHQAVPNLSETQVHWLRELSRNTTVTSLARSAGYSEREMYRLLSGVYARLGASTRTEALLRAAQCGLLRNDEPSRVVDLAAHERTAVPRQDNRRVSG